MRGLEAGEDGARSVDGAVIDEEDLGETKRRLFGLEFLADALESGDELRQVLLALIHGHDDREDRRCHESILPAAPSHPTRARARAHRGERLVVSLRYLDRVSPHEPPAAPAPRGFDRFADEYARCHRIGGEDRGYFAKARLEWLRFRLTRLRFAPRTVLDFGCGTGSTIPLLFEILRPSRVIALEESESLLAMARRDYGTLDVSFALQPEFQEPACCDLVFCSAVFHHVPPAERTALLRVIRGYLKPNGLFALWEHNAWSPAARYIMSRCEFDRDAHPLSPRVARRLLREAGFEILSTDFLFLFPNFLRALRPLETLVRKLPLGAQFQVLARNS